jgi:hypothetical protein
LRNFYCTLDLNNIFSNYTSDSDAKPVQPEVKDELDRILSAYLADYNIKNLKDAGLTPEEIKDVKEIIIKIETSVTSITNILGKPYTIRRLEDNIRRMDEAIKQRKNAMTTLCLSDISCKCPNYEDHVVDDELKYLQSISGRYSVLQRILPKLREYLKIEYEKEVSFWHTKGNSPGSII